MRKKGETLKKQEVKFKAWSFHSPLENHIMQLFLTGFSRERKLKKLEEREKVERESFNG